MQNDLIPFEELAKRRGNDAVKQQEIPDTHAISLGLPTLRAKRPGYAYFASPATRIPGQLQVQEAPDRWWVISAENAKLLMYARQDVVAFVTGAQYGREELTPPQCTLEELKAHLKKVRELLNAAAPVFFRGESTSKAERAGIADLLGIVIPLQIQPQYRALVPDFYQWLEA